MPSKRPISIPSLFCRCEDCKKYGSYTDPKSGIKGVLWDQVNFKKHQANLRHQRLNPLLNNSCSHSKPPYTVTQVVSKDGLNPGTINYELNSSHKSLDSTQSAWKPERSDVREVQHNPEGPPNPHIEFLFPGLVKDIPVPSIFLSGSYRSCTLGLLDESFDILGPILLASCQYLLHRVSMRTANSTLKVTSGIYDLTCDTNDSLRKIPTDIRSILKNLNLEPKLSRCICCPKCFSLYPIHGAPIKCLHRETPRSNDCNEPLFMDRKGYSHLKPVPCRLYTTYPLCEWLAQFLNRPGIEDLLDMSLQDRPQHDGLMYDVWDSPMWTKEKNHDGTPFTSTSGNLAFSLGVDWFNPWGNKAAGKSASLGAIVLTCLNLPLSHRYREENIYIAGIIPGPKEPDVVQVRHVLRPAVQDLLQLWDGVHFSSTSRAPKEGRVIRGMVIQIICDLVGVRKVMGLASHSTTNNPCSICDVTKDELEMLDLSMFSRKTNTGIREAASDWYQATTLADREHLFEKNGVRYSPLLELPYLLPISHVVVEPMHNIFLGILRYHGQALMGLKIDKKAMAIDYDDDSESEGEHTGEDKDKLDMNDIQEELDAELEELKIRPDIDMNLEDYHHHLNQTASVDLTQTKQGSDIHEHYDSDEEDDLDYCATGIQREKDGSSSLCSEQLENLPLLFSDRHTFKLLSTVIDQIHLPTWIGRVPRTVGQACGGKLKADEWANLFTVILIPVLGNVYTEAPNHTKTCLLHNFFHLVSAANLIRSPVTNQQHVNSLKMHIQSYRINLRQLFPQMRPRPNHHMALHIPEAMARFGPASVWTMWVHERMNGVLRMIPNNHQIRALDLTLLRRFVTSANLKSQLPKFCEKLPEPLKTSILEFLGPTNSSGSHHDCSDNLTWPPRDEKKLVCLGQRVRAKLISRLQKVEKLSIHVPKLGNSDVQAGEVVIPPWVLPMNSFKYQGRHYSVGSHSVGNGTIKYRVLQTNSTCSESYGSIRQIFTIAYGSSQVPETWLEVQPFRELTDSDKPHDPYAGWPNVKTKLAYMHESDDTDCASRDSTSWHIIKCSEIISHSSLYVAPGGSFSIQQPTAILTELPNHARYSYPKI